MGILVASEPMRNELGKNNSGCTSYSIRTYSVCPDTRLALPHTDPVGLHGVNCTSMKLSLYTVFVDVLSVVSLFATLTVPGDASPTSPGSRVRC